MFKQLTVTSAAEYDRILYGQMTPQMAVSYLLENRLPVRTFSGVLQQMYPGKDLQMRLVDFFCFHNAGSKPPVHRQKDQELAFG